MNRELLQRQALFTHWIVSEEPDQIIKARDRDIPHGQGFRLILSESPLYYQASIEFEDFAFELINRTDHQIKGGAPGWLAGLLDNDRYLKFKIFRRSVQINFGESQADGLSLELERKKIASFSAVNFLDYVASFIYFLFPYEIEGQEEGAVLVDLQTRYERSNMNRAICLAYHGYTCKACKTDLQAKYGQVAKNFIHVHHLNPVSTAGIVKPDPVRDMIPLCPNCHGIAHLRTPPYTVEEIRHMIDRNNAEIHA